MKKQLLILMMTLLPMVASADAGGTCGENAIWSYEESTQILYVSGSGNIANYNINTSPWSSIRSRVRQIAIGEGITGIGTFAFYYFTNLTSVVFPSTLTSIGDNAFNLCWCLKYADIPDGVTSIGREAFAGCSDLLAVNIPKSLITWGTSVLSNCSSLTSVVIPYGVTSISERTFSGCTRLKTIVIPNSVTSIESYAFWGCSKLASISLPEKLTSITQRVFYGCKGLTYILIPEGVVSIEDYAFQECTGLSSITLPNSLTTIGEQTLSGCAALQSLTIPTNVISIGSKAFDGCSNLSEICVQPSSPPLASDDTFSNYSLYLYVPKTSVSKYKYKSPWYKFLSVEGTEFCATPTISYQYGHVFFNCDTYDVKYVSNITYPTASKQYDSSVPLSTTCLVSVYATKSNYKNSQTITQEIDICGKKGDVNQDGAVTISDAVGVVNIILNEGK